MPLFRKPGTKQYIIDNSKTYQTNNINAQFIPQVITPLDGNESILVLQGGRYKSYPLANLVSDTPPPEPIPYLCDIAPYISSGISLRQLVSGWDTPFIDVYRGENDVLSFSFGEDGTTDFSNAGDWIEGNDLSVGYLSDQIRFFETGANQYEYALQPSLISAGLAAGFAKSCLYFPGDTQHKQLVGFSSITTVLPITIICVVAIPAQTKGAFFKTGGDSTGIGIGIGGNTYNAIGQEIIGLKEGIEWNPSLESLALNTPTIIEYSVSASGAIALFVNGISKTISHSNTNVNASSGEYFIGGYSSLYGGQFYDRYPSHYFFESVIIDRLITTQERSDIVGNMATYYGIS